MPHASSAASLLTATLATALAAHAQGQIGPDIAPSELHSVVRWGSLGGSEAFSFGVSACNLGDADVAYDAVVSDGTPANRHPVIAQNLYRYHDGRFVQLGRSWVLHTFFALDLAGICGNPCSPSPLAGRGLGPGCHDSLTAAICGNQAAMGDRSDINAATGQYPFPFTGDGQTGDVLLKRMQVPTDDLNSALFPGALYVGECHIIAPDDANANNDHNNASHRTMRTSPVSGGWNLVFEESTRLGEPAIFAWRHADPNVQLTPVDVPGDGRFWVASRATELGDGSWRYEYAVQNLSSDRAASALTIPVGNGVTISDADFRDVDPHSGSPYDPTDWSTAVDPGKVRWTAPAAYAADPNTNALRWGTMYNFWIIADAPPSTGSATLTLFKPGPADDPRLPLPVPGQPCPVDTNSDGELTPADFNAWIIAFNNNAPECDQNNDDLCTPADFNAWILNFNAGCG